MKKPGGVSRWLLVLALGAVTTPAAMASTLTGPKCAAGSFTSYERLASGCTSGVIQLLNFSLYFVDPRGGLTLAPTSFTDTITVDPVFQGGIMRMVVGGFQAYPVGPTQTMAYMINFESDPPPVMGGESVEIDPPTGHITGGEDYCGHSFLPDGGIVEGCTQQGSLNFDEVTPASVTFSPPLYDLTTQTTVRLNPAALGTALAALGVASSFDGVVYTIFTTPEPSTWLLAVSALGLATARRKRLNRDRAKG